MMDFFNECIAPLAYVPATHDYTMCPLDHVILKLDAVEVNGQDFCSEEEASEHWDAFLDESEQQYDAWEAQRDTEDFR